MIAITTSSSIRVKPHERRPALVFISALKIRGPKPAVNRPIEFSPLSGWLTNGAKRRGAEDAEVAQKMTSLRIPARSALLSPRIVARREDTSSGLERRFVTGFARWVVPSQLQTGASLWLRLGRAGYLRFTPFVNQPDKQGIFWPVRVPERRPEPMGGSGGTTLLAAGGATFAIGSVRFVARPGIAK